MLSLMGICLEAAKVVVPISISLKVDRFRDERISRNSVKSLAELLTVNQELRSSKVKRRRRSREKRRRKTRGQGQGAPNFLLQMDRIRDRGVVSIDRTANDTPLS